MPGVELKTSECDGHVVVALRGELDVTGATDVGAAIMTRIARGQALIVDMSALGFVDCAALDALVRAREAARRGGGDVMLAGPQPHVRRLLVLRGQDHVFEVQASVQAAVASMASAGRDMVGGGLR